MMNRYAAALSGLNLLAFSCEKAKRMLRYRPGTSVDHGMSSLSDRVKEVVGVERLIA